MSDRRLMLVDRKKPQTNKNKKQKQKQIIKNLTKTTAKNPRLVKMTIYHKAGTDSTNSTV